MSAYITFHCPDCGEQSKDNFEKVGEEIKCPKCGWTGNWADLDTNIEEAGADARMEP